MSAAQFRVVRPTSHFVIYALATEAHGIVLVTAAHLPSKLRYSPSTQRKVASDLAEEIIRMQRRLKTSHGILMGDLNMNPFDPGMIEADALNAVSAKRVASDGGRNVNGKSYPMFYNPMWSHMGDGLGNPPGTFYRRTTDNDCIFFHTLDQVLVRPSLIPLLGIGSVQVLTGDGVDQFLSPTAIPRKSTLSDHLPIHLELDL